MTSSRPTGKSGWLTALVAVAGGLGAQAACAEANPYFIGVSQSFTHDSNVFRETKREGKNSDIISGTAVFAGIDQPIGRQRLYASAALQANRFDKLSRLNYLGSDLGAGLDWSTIGRLSGGLKYTRNRGQGDFSRPEAGQTTGKNVQTTDQIAANAKYEISSRTTFDAGLEHRKIDVGNRAFISSEVTSDVARAGLKYGVSGLLTVGAGVRYTRDKRPNALQVEPGEFVGQRTTRRDLDLTADWSPTPVTQLDVRVSFGSEERSRSRGSSSRVTGAVNAGYQPTSKLRFSARVSRDTGTETTFQSVPTSTPAPVTGANGLFVDSNRLTTSYNIAATYAVTSKIGMSANYDRSQGSYQSVSGNSFDNNTSIYGLGANYNATNKLSFQCQLRRETRNGESEFVRSFSANTASCLVRYLIQ